MNINLVKQIFPEMIELIKDGKCPLCKQEVDKSEFRDDLSRLEFQISGLCQECQDNMFGK